MTTYEAEGEMGDLQIICGSASERLAQDIATDLGLTACMPTIEFPNGEYKTPLPMSVRGQDVYVVQSHYASLRAIGGNLKERSPHDAIFEQQLLIDAARSSSARHITAVIPFAGYGREDRRTGRHGVTGARIFESLGLYGADEYVTVDMHSAQTAGSFLVDHLTAAPVLASHLRKLFPVETVPKFIIMSPDSGGLPACERLANQFDGQASVAHIKKRRNSDGTAETVNVDYEDGIKVEGLPHVLFDDMVDGASTITAAARAADKRGASQIIVAATHGVFSARAAERLAASPIDKVVITDTLELSAAMRELSQDSVGPEIEILPLAGFLARAIRCIHNNESLQDFHGAVPQFV